MWQQGRKNEWVQVSRFRSPSSRYHQPRGVAQDATTRESSRALPSSPVKKRHSRATIGRHHVQPSVWSGLCPTPSGTVTFLSPTSRSARSLLSGCSRRLAGLDVPRLGVTGSVADENDVVDPSHPAIVEMDVRTGVNHGRTTTNGLDETRPGVNASIAGSQSGSIARQRLIVRALLGEGSRIFTNPGRGMWQVLVHPPQRCGVSLEPLPQPSAVGLRCSSH